ncbi:MAG: hypothetical protein KDA21_11055, partial [Phycisphaerales bacterium]|nr:hypothetical protein [Phycisphaerales bacterium]
HGRIEALEARWDPAASNGTVVELPASGPRADMSGQVISAAELAVAGALATHVGAADLQPLSGHTRSLGLPWLVPVAATLLGLAVVWASFRVTETRYLHAAADIRAQREAMAGDLRAVADARNEAARLVRTIDEGVNKATADWKPILPVVHAAQMSVPFDGFLYSLDVQPTTVTVSGEAVRSGDVLQTLEEDARFADARLLYAVTIVPERGLEKFDIQARRVDVTKGGVH